MENNDAERTRRGRTAVLVEPHEEELVLLLAAEVHNRHGARAEGGRKTAEWASAGALARLRRFLSRSSGEKDAERNGSVEFQYEWNTRFWRGRAGYT